MHFPLRNIRHQIFVERNWINTTGHYFHSSANFCPRSSFSSSKYRAVFVISYRTLQVFNPVGNFCALIFRFAHFFVVNGGFAYSQLESDNYFFVFINFTLGSLKSKLVWDYGWRPMFPAVIAVVVCTFIIVLWNTSYSFLTLESITRIGLSSISYAGFLSVWLVQHPLPLIWLTNFIYFSKFHADLLYNRFGLISTHCYFLGTYFKTQQSSVIFDVSFAATVEFMRPRYSIHCYVRSRFWVFVSCLRHFIYSYWSVVLCLKLQSQTS